MIFGNYPFSHVELRLHHIFSNPIVVTKSRPPPRCLELFPICVLFDNWIKNVVFFPSSNRIALIQTIVEIIVSFSCRDFFLSIDFGGDICTALRYVPTWLGNDSDVRIWEKLINKLANSDTNFIKIFSGTRLNVGEPTTDI